MSDEENEERELNQMEKALKKFGELKEKENKKNKENIENIENRNIKIDDIEDDKLNENEKINNENNIQENEENNNNEEIINNENEENEEIDKQENNKENEQINDEDSEKDKQNSIKENNMDENNSKKEINNNDNIETNNNENISQLSKNKEINNTKSKISKISKKSNKSNKKEYNYEKEEKSIQESAKNEVENEFKKIFIMKTKKFKSFVDIMKEKEEKNILSNFLKLSYYFKTKHIKNIKKKNQEVIIDEVLDVPTEATLVEKLKSCDKQIIPPNPLYYYGGNLLKSFNKDINKEVVKNYKKIIPSVQNMSVKPNKDLTILGTEKKIIGEFKETPAFLDVIIEQKEEKKKSVARKAIGKNFNSKYMNENLEKKTTNGKDDCLIF